MAAGEMDTVISLLHPDVTLVGDSNGKVRTAINVIKGPDKVARFLFGLASRYGPAWLASSRLALVNGEVGSLQRRHAGRRRLSARGTPGRRAGRAGRQGRRRLGHRQPGQVHRLAACESSVAHGTRHASPELKPCSVMPSAEYMRARMFSTPI